eukprot:363662-Chlamydomonas_euryale.AAC.17
MGRNVCLKCRIHVPHAPARCSVGASLRLPSTVGCSLRRRTLAAPDGQMLATSACAGSEFNPDSPLLEWLDSE